MGQINPLKNPVCSNTSFPLAANAERHHLRESPKTCLTYCGEEEHKYFKYTQSWTLVALPSVGNAPPPSSLPQIEPWQLAFFVFIKNQWKKRVRVTPQIALSFVCVCFKPSEQTSQNEKPYFVWTPAKQAKAHLSTQPALHPHTGEKKNNNKTTLRTTIS